MTTNHVWSDTADTSVVVQIHLLLGEASSTYRNNHYGAQRFLVGILRDSSHSDDLALRWVSLFDYLKEGENTGINTVFIMYSEAANEKREIESEKPISAFRKYLSQCIWIPSCKKYENTIEYTIFPLFHRDVFIWYFCVLQTYTNTTTVVKAYYNTVLYAWVILQYTTCLQVPRLVTVLDIGISVLGTYFLKKLK